MLKFVLIIGIVLLIGLRISYSYSYKWDADDIGKVEQVSNVVKGMTGDGEKIAVFYFQPEIYFYSKREPSIIYIYYALDCKCKNPE